MTAVTAALRIAIRSSPTLALPFSTAALTYEIMASSSSSTVPTIDCSRFYSEWKGHPIDDLTTVRTNALAERPERPIVYLAGDSSLDNKFWVNNTSPIVAGQLSLIYRDLFKCPIIPKPDVAFWMNSLLEDRATCINTAVEASMLRERDEALLPHDEFIRDNIRANDALIVSVGANDIALNPSASTIRHMLQLAWL
jgi:hypothetical protein